MELLRVVPGLDQAITDGVRRGLISTLIIKVEASSGESVLNVVDDGSLNGAFVGTDIASHELPHLLVSFIWGWLAELRSVESRRLFGLSTLFQVKT